MCNFLHGVPESARWKGVLTTFRSVRLKFILGVHLDESVSPSVLRRDDRPEADASVSECVRERTQRDRRLFHLRAKISELTDGRAIAGA